VIAGVVLSVEVEWGRWVNPKGRVGSWPLHDIVITNIVWCMAYQREFEGGSYIAE